MDQFHRGALLVVVNNISVKDISVFDARPYKDLCFISPLAYHVFQWESEKGCFGFRSWTHNRGDSIARRYKGDFLGVIYWANLELYPATDINSRRKTDILPPDPKNVFPNFVVPNIGHAVESFSEYKSTQVSFSHFFGAFDHFPSSKPEVRRKDCENSSNDSEPNSSIQRPPFVRRLLTALICLIIGLILVFWSGKSFYDKRKLFRASLIGIGLLITFAAFFLYAYCL
jgi:hypothetical protein